MEFRGRSSIIIHHFFSMPRVSVIIPTFNRAAIVPKAITSVLSQSFRDFELIVVDDGSADETREVVEAIFKRSDGALSYLYKENGGEASARNRGLAEARGEYVAFLDSDDVWLPNHLSECVNALDGNPSLGAVFTDHNITRGGNTLVRTTANVGASYRELKRNLVTRKLVLASDAVMIRRDVFSRLGGFDEDLEVGADWEMWARIAASYEIGYVPRRTVTVLQHADNTSSQPHKIEVNVRKAIDRIMQYAGPDVLELKSKIIARSHSDNAYFYSMNGDRSKALKNLVLALKLDFKLLIDPTFKASMARIILGRRGFGYLRELRHTRKR